MTQPLRPDEIEQLARRRAGAKLGWYTHAFFYVVVNALMFVLSYAGHMHRPWSVFPVLGWGFGLAMHGIAVFVLGNGSGLRERMVQRERDRIQRQQDRPGR